MSNNKQIEKPLELPHQETIVGTNTIQTKPFDNQKAMSNNKQMKPFWKGFFAGWMSFYGVYKIIEFLQQ